MHTNVYEKQLVSEIRVQFPVAARTTDQWLMDRGDDETDLQEMTYRWIEAFADRVRDAARAEDFPSIRDQTNFMAEKYLSGSDAVKSIIDVAYAENILWDASEKEKASAWPLVSKTIRQLYEEMWGPTSIPTNPGN